MVRRTKKALGRRSQSQGGHGRASGKGGGRVQARPEGGVQKDGGSDQGAMGIKPNSDVVDKLAAKILAVRQRAGVQKMRQSWATRL